MNPTDISDLARLEGAIIELDRSLRRLAITPRAACDANCIAKRSRELRGNMPKELKLLYSRFGGVDADAMPLTTSAIRIWPVFEIRLANAREITNFGECIIFADFLLSSMEYAFDIATKAVVLVNGKHSAVVASDLADFLTKCARDDPALYGGHTQ